MNHLQLLTYLCFEHLRCSALHPLKPEWCHLNGSAASQMVSNGNEGYRAYGPYDPLAPLSYPFLNWMNSGLKGTFMAPV